MAYQVLARKWRPKKFADLVGQEHVVKALQNALDKGRLHHAYLLTGTRGVGKTTIARILAKSLNCEHPAHGEPCGTCTACTQIDAGRYVDLLEIDAASNTGIDNIREVLENAQYAPTAGKYKVYIIDEVHMLSKSAFNAMLKTLEEPPGHVKFILATTDPHKVPVTVLSRCLQFVLRNMTAQQAAAHLEHVLAAEQIPCEQAALHLLARAANGSMRDALSLLDQAIAMGSGNVAEADVRQMIGAVDKRYLYELIGALAAQNGEALLHQAQEMAERAVGFDNALAELALLLQRLALIQTVPAAVPADDPERETLRTLASALSGEQIQLYYQCAIRGKQDLSLAPDEYAGFVMTLLRMLAFAPLAAPAQDGAQIAGTALHDPVPEAAVQNQPAAPVSTAPVAADGVAQNADSPPWEEAAAPQQADGFATSAAQRPSEKKQADAGARADMPARERPSENLLSERHGVQAAETEAEQDGAGGREESSDSRPSENTESAAGIPEAAAFPEAAAQTAAVSASSANDPVQAEAQRPSENSRSKQQPQREEAEEADWDDGLIPFDDLPTQPESGADGGEADEEEADFAPLPALAAENWHAIVRRLKKRLSAAQMLADNMAWTRYDGSACRLFFALNGNSRTTTTKEYFDKIRDTLAEAYCLPDLAVQTEVWQADQGWETPAIRRRRIQQEGRQEARRRLEADPACQTLMAAVQAQGWIEGSLKRTEDLGEYDGEAEAV